MALPPEQAKALGLDDVEPSGSRTLAPAQAKALGLDDPEPGTDVPGMVRAGLHGVLSNIGVDPAKAAAELESFGGLTGNYDKALAENRQNYDKALADHPTLAGLGEIAPAMLAPAKVPLQAGMGAVRGYTNSKADTFGGKLKDAAIEGGLSGAGTKIGNAIAGWAAGGPLARWLGSKTAQADADGLAKAAEAAAADVQSAKSALGAKAADVMRTREVLSREAGNVAPELAAEAQAKLGSDAAKARVTNAYQNYLGRADQGLDDIVAAEAKLAEAKAVDPAAQWAAKSASPWASEVKPRLATYATRAIPAYLGQKVGSEVGGTDGRVVGGLAGFGAGIALGNPGTAVANMLKSPTFRKGASNATAAALRGAGRGAGKLAQLLGVTSDDEAEALIKRFADEQQ